MKNPTKPKPIPRKVSYEELNATFARKDNIQVDEIGDIRVLMNFTTCQMWILPGTRV